MTTDLTLKFGFPIYILYVIFCFVIFCSKASPITALSLSEPTTTTEEPVTPIGPWEQWMIRKTKSMKKLSNQKARLERMRKEQERQQEEEQRQKLLKAERIIQV